MIDIDRYGVSSGIQLLKDLADAEVFACQQIESGEKYIKDWNKYFMKIAKVVSEKSSCSRRQVAAVIVNKDNMILSTGYNGTPRGTTNCNAGGCPRCSTTTGEGGTNLDSCLCSHAEENAIAQAAYSGVAIKDATLYVTLSPCLHCAKLVINAGIKTVIFEERYPNNDVAFALLNQGGVAAYAL